MALLSPGVQVTVIDESQYIPASTNSVPYILIATAQNKVSGTGTGVAAGTLKANANKPYLITSQRDLSATFGVPFFYKTTAGTPINGYELNEYGLLAAYSALGITNQAYVQRCDIDLSELTASLTRPTGAPNNGTYWLDTANSLWGIFQWNQTTGVFTNQVPLIITDSTQLVGTAPLPSVGSIGNYAINALNIHLPGYYKRGGPTDATAPDWQQPIPGTDPQEYYTASDLYNSWVLVGSDEWKTSWPTITGTQTVTTLSAGAFAINGVTVTVTGGDELVDLVTNINQLGIPGVYAAGTTDFKLQLYADSTTENGDSSDVGGGIYIENITNTPLTQLGITANNTYLAPQFEAQYNYNQPNWRTTSTTPAPTGSVWQKMNSVNLGVNLVFKKYNSTLGTFVQQSMPIYGTIAEAIYSLDPSGGGINIPLGTTFGIWNPTRATPGELGIQIYECYSTGQTVVTGTNSSPSFTAGNQFTIRSSVPGSATLTNSYVVTLSGTTAPEFVADISAAAVPYVSATIDSSGTISFIHSAGGQIVLVETAGTPITVGVGINDTIEGVDLTATSSYALTKFTSDVDYFTYSASSTAPDQDPADGHYWYYATNTQADIMIQNGGEWVGYKNVTNDVRGDNLQETYPGGPIFSATAPTTWPSSTHDLVYGDLWIDTSDLENYPLVNRWTNVNGVDQWVRIDNTDQTTENGILFADARWAPNGTTNPITDNIPTISSLLTSNYLDIDAPDPGLYPQGMLLWNTRRSGFNVKSFQVEYFNPTDFSFPSWESGTSYVVGDKVLYNALLYVCIANTSSAAPSNTTYWSPLQTNAWVTASGNRADGSPYMGRHAQRVLVVQALKSGIDSNVAIREEQRQFNLIACPQYPELIPNMVVLDNDRNDTAFVIGDTPLRLAPTADTLVAWATNGNGATTTNEDGLVDNTPYLGVFYPSCQTNDLSGTTVVQPPSHMMIRTIIRSDEVAYPWLAPAGTRRGVIDNAARIGYINGATGEFETIGVNQGLRDVLYTNNINPITFVPGTGITNFGNKTTQGATTALDRINVARLVAFIRGRLNEIGKTFLFEPNDQITRNEITNAINSLMIDLVNKRGIYDYLVVCDLSNNTPARIDANELWVDIAIEPVKAVEFIYIPLRLKNTGEIAASLAVTATAG